MRDPDHCDRLFELGCIVCLEEYGVYSPPQIHHLRDGQGMAQRASDHEAIPLCPRHHTDGGHGVAIHAGQEAFEANYGTERELLALTLKKLDQQHD